MSKSFLPVFFQEFYSIRSYIQGFNVLIYSFTYICPVLPAPLFQETAFYPLYILASFVADYLTISVWVYFWAFYPIPLIYVSVFVPVPYCFDYCSVAVQPEVREHDSFSSLLLSQGCFGYLRSFVFPHKLKNFCSSSVKNAIRNLIGIALNPQISTQFLKSQIQYAFNYYIL